MHYLHPLFLIVLLLFYALTSFSQGLIKPHEDRSRWSVEGHFGAVHNFEMPLVISQDGYHDISITAARFTTEPFNIPFYWDSRITKWFGRNGLCFEVIHHKIHLANRPPEVERFAVSHGYNMLLFNYFRNLRWFNASVGAGTVLMHPESTIRGMKWPEGPGSDIGGYRLRGYVLSAALSRQLRLSGRFYLNVEAKLTWSQSTVPIVNGQAEVQNLAFHLVFGPGVNWAYR